MIALSRHRKRISRKLFFSPHILLFLDYDGTLTPIVETPAKARIPKETRNLLIKLKILPSITVCIVSGRSLSDIRKMVGVNGLVYAGNHGLEGIGKGFRFKEPKLRASRKIMRRLKIELAKGLKGIKGFLIEDKLLTLSVHYRLVKKKDLALFKRRFHSCIKNALDKKAIKLTYGKRVFEIRPPIKWDKGRFVNWFIRLAKRQKKLRDILPVYIGDDRTDEDAFRVLRSRGLTIFVGKRKKSFAKYYLNSVNGVQNFLGDICEIRKEMSTQF